MQEAEVAWQAAVKARERAELSTKAVAGELAECQACVADALPSTTRLRSSMLDRGRRHPPSPEPGPVSRAARDQPCTPRRRGGSPSYSGATPPLPLPAPPRRRRRRCALQARVGQRDAELAQARASSTAQRSQAEQAGREAARARQQLIDAHQQEVADLRKVSRARPAAGCGRLPRGGGGCVVTAARPSGAAAGPPCAPASAPQRLSDGSAVAAELEQTRRGAEAMRQLYAEELERASKLAVELGRAQAHLDQSSATEEGLRRQLLKSESRVGHAEGAAGASEAQVAATAAQLQRVVQQLNGCQGEQSKTLRPAAAAAPPQATARAPQRRRPSW